MTVLPPLRSAALVLLRESAAVHAGEMAKNGPVEAILAASRDNRAGVAASPTQAEASISESVFSVNHKSASELKLDLLERTGREFGLEMDGFDSPQEFGTALRRLVSKLRLEPNGEMALKAVERKLGLDELGLNIDDIVNAASDPDGDAGKKVEKALAEKHGLDDKAEEGAEDETPLLVVTDATGLYAIA